MPTSISFVDLQPSQAVARAREAVVEGAGEALEALDRHFRHGFLRFVQDRGAAPDELRDALLAACQWMEREKREPWCTQWPYLMELLRDAESVPALAADLRALGAAEGRAAAVLSVLASEPRPLRPNQLRDRLGMSAQQVANVCRRLESAELIVRRQAGGRATWISPTRRGSQLAALLPDPSTGPQPERREARVRENVPADTPMLSLWNSEAFSLPVPRIQ